MSTFVTGSDPNTNIRIAKLGFGRAVLHSRKEARSYKEFAYLAGGWCSSPAKTWQRDRNDLGTWG